MKGYEDAIEGLDAQTDGLRQTVETTSETVTGFDSELRRMRESLAATGKDVAALERGLSKGLRKAFDGLVFDGASLAECFGHGGHVHGEQHVQRSHAARDGSFWGPPGLWEWGHLRRVFCPLLTAHRSVRGA